MNKKQTHTNGKGSKSRVSDHKRFNQNHDDIQWPSKKKLDKQPRKK